MGWTVLYIAFGFVALWLLGEVLLQYKARLRWRLLAFTGFLGVVLGVLMPSVFVIVLGALAFAVGQTYVTLSFRRGFSTGWALGGRPGASRRRRSGSRRAAQQEPTLEVSDLEFEPVAPVAVSASVFESAAESTSVFEPVAVSASVFESAAESTSVFEPLAVSAPVYEPQPLPEDTGQYGAYQDTGYLAGVGEDRSGGFDHAYAGYEQPAGQEAYVAREAAVGQDAYAGRTAYPEQDVYATQFDYGTAGHQQYSAYSDPYTGSATGGQQYGADDESVDSRQQYADPHYGSETPPGGVWVPQQREMDGQAPPPQEQPWQPGYDPGYDGQSYRY